MAADINSRSISEEFDSSIAGEINHEEPAPTQEGLIVIESIAGDFTLVLVNALELFGEFQDSMPNDATAAAELETSTQKTGHEVIEATPGEIVETTIMGTQPAELEGWEIIDKPENMDIDTQERPSTDPVGPFAKTECEDISIDEASLNKEDSAQSSGTDNRGTDNLTTDNLKVQGDFLEIQFIGDSELELITEDTNELLATYESDFPEIKVSVNQGQKTANEGPQAPEQQKTTKAPDIAEVKANMVNSEESSDELTKEIRNMKFNFFTHKHSKHKPKKKKWKPAPSSILGFDFCSLTNRQLECTDVEMLTEMEKELEKFENEQLKQQEADDSCISIDQKTTDATQPTDDTQENKQPNLQAPKETDVTSEPAEVKVTKRKPRKRNRQKDNYDLYDSEFNSESCNYKNTIAAQMLERISDTIFKKMEPFEGLNGDKRLRNKKKWQFTKSHRAKKMKLGYNKSVYTTLKSVYVNRRVLETLKCEGTSRRRNIIASRSLRDIDRAGLIYADVYRPLYAPAPRNQWPNNPDRPNARNNPPPRYALNRNNADNELDANLVNILINIQERDLTPEDYELLLRLDETVAPKTVQKGLLENLVTDKATAEDTQEACTICMDRYTIGEERKYLPCGHIFHTQCIDQWLTNSSQNCPLDNLPIDPS